jgi:hypothetical protein
MKTKSSTAKIERLRFQFANGLCELRELAKTDPCALEVLATELFNQIRWLNKEALKGPDHYRRLIRRCASWPAVVSADKEIQGAQLWFAVTMGLGKDFPLNLSGRQSSREIPEIVAARELIDWIQRRGDKLPPLNRDTAPRWWKCARPLFEQLYGKRFEQHPLFAGKYAAKNLRPDHKDTSLNRATWARKQILSKMPQAFHSLARKV